MDKIFVQIAAYRDPQLVPTVEDMIAKAKNPERLTFGICWQYGPEDDIDRFDSDSRFRISKKHFSESQGLGWARNLTNLLYAGEKYTLQIDSHHRFVQDWDEMLLEDYNSALQISPKPIITTYAPMFDPKEDPAKRHPYPCLMSQYEFSRENLLMSRPYDLYNYKNLDRIIRARTISAHLMFTSGEFINEVPYDPDIFFGGYTEEITLSARAYTNGYDLFSPYRIIMWHEYIRDGRPKHWDDHGSSSQTSLTSGQRDDRSRDRTRQLLGFKEYGIDLGIYGLGTARTLRDYETYAGFDFKGCRLQEYTLLVKEPPNPTPWEDNFITPELNLHLTWDLDFFKNQNLESPQLVAIGIISKEGFEIYRTDLRDPEYIYLQKGELNAIFKSSYKPEFLLIHLLDARGNWSQRYEKKIGA
jgi:hypothetical protein